MGYADLVFDFVNACDIFKQAGNGRLVQRYDGVVCFGLFVDQRIPRADSCLLLFTLFLRQCNRSYQRNVFGIFRRDGCRGRAAAFVGAHPRVFQQPFRLYDALWRRSGARIFRVSYIPEGKWWFIGFILSIVHIATWLVVGGLWWKVLGIW